MTKQSAILLFLFGFCVFNGFSQIKDAPAIESNLYARTLSVCLAKEADEYGNLGSNRVDYENRIVEHNIYLTDKLPAQFGKIKVEYLDAAALRERYKKLRREIQVLSLRPMKNDGSILKISIGNYWFNYKKKSYNYALEGGCTAEYKFDSSTGNFVLAKIDLWGI